MNKGRTVYVGMSGGVDSSLSAALLKEQGFNVVGVFIKVWSPEWMPCTWPDERRDAMRVAAHLKIPFKTLDLESEYKRGVVDYMISEYSAGRTPNPDVLCNKEVKFGAFLSWALGEGADFVATGHYARVKRRGDVYQLLRGVDASKDQSYFLWTLTQKQLGSVLFPVGDFPKAQVRAEALRRGIPVAEKKDSQGLCFMGHVDIKEFLSRYIEVTPGSVLDEAGVRIGEHKGALMYTLGERHGFTITEKDRISEPQYVVKKDVSLNTITVAPRSQTQSFAQRNFELLNSNWIVSPEEKKYVASIRYHQEPLSCSVLGLTTIVFDEPITAAKGQSVVVYDGDLLVGGGVVA